MRSRSRSIGVVYLLYFVTAISAAAITGRGFIELGDAVNVFATACYAAVTVLFYFLFKAVNRNISLLAAVFSLAGCAIAALNVYGLAAGINPLALFGPYCLLLGYLILRGAFLPRPLGVLMVLAGLSWIVFLTPFAHAIATALMILGFFAEAGLMLWLLVFGVDERRWQDLAGRVR